MEMQARRRADVLFRSPTHLQILDIQSLLNGANVGVGGQRGVSRALYTLFLSTELVLSNNSEPEIAVPERADFGKVAKTRLPLKASYSQATALGLSSSALSARDCAHEGCRGVPMAPLAGAYFSRIPDLAAPLPGGFWWSTLRVGRINNSAILQGAIPRYPSRYGSLEHLVI